MLKYAPLGMILALGAGVWMLRPAGPPMSPVPTMSPVKPPGVGLIGGNDASDSVRDNLLGPAAAATVRLVARLDPDHDWVMLYRVDRATQRFLGPEVPQSQEALQETLVIQLRDSALRSGTYPAEFWEQAVVEADRAPGPVAVFLFSDGDNDDPSPQAAARIRAAATRLAANRRVVAVGIYGVKREHFKTLDRQFAALGLERFRIYLENDLNTEWLSRRLEEARR